MMRPTAGKIAKRALCNTVGIGARIAPQVEADATLPYARSTTLITATGMVLIIRA